MYLRYIKVQATQFFISTEDVLVRRFGGDRIKSAMSMFKWDENEAVENKMISRSIESAQSKVEAYHFEIRKTNCSVLILAFQLSLNSINK